MLAAKLCSVDDNGQLRSCNNAYGETVWRA